ncbi:MAG: multiheme c-type cytochrome [Limisphaerales bacterium]
MVQAPIAEGPNKTILGDFSIASTNHPALKDVKGVVGSRWKQRYLVEQNGEEVVFNGQWSVKEHKWQPYTAKSDWWWDQHKDWKQRSNFKLCAGCHSTGLDTQTQQWRELNISCESCHGAGRKHSETSRLEDIVNPARLSRDRSMDVCLSCHQAGRPHGAQTEYAWAVGYQPGDDLRQFWQAFEPEAKVTPEFWLNGTAHKNCCCYAQPSSWQRRWCSIAWVALLESFANNTSLKPSCLRCPPSRARPAGHSTSPPPLLPKQSDARMKKPLRGT